MAFDAELVEVGGLGRIQWLERQVIDDEQVCPDEAADLGFQGVVEPGCFADWAEDQRAVRAVEDPQADQLVPQLPVVADGGGLS